MILPELCENATINVFGPCDYTLIYQFILAKQVKNVYINYGPGLDRILYDIRSQDNFVQLTLAGDWPDHCSRYLESLAKRDKSNYIDLQNSNLLISANVVKVVVDRWKKADGNLKIEVIGKHIFGPDEVNDLFELSDMKNHQNVKCYSMEIKTGRFGLVLNVEQNRLNLKNVAYY
ncbi:hypothetical protein L596_021523 [Steinernema carpocapsae]|nr:hypothetical protein L596_021523 [Steinernema carpocapsae]